ncbi:MAG TPA: hypothetical protein VKT28_21910 [Puia sp.]|nr:hypothetical protein [Puia sp.]
MSGHFENINFWAEKLQQISLPDAEQQWQSMEAMLDAEMPVSKNKDWRRWLILIILLLLLIGVCNCPGIMKMNKFSANNDVQVEDKQSNQKEKQKSGNHSSSIHSSDSLKMNNGSKTENADETINAKESLKENEKEKTHSKNADLTTNKLNNSFKKKDLEATKNIITPINSVLIKKKDAKEYVHSNKIKKSKTSYNKKQDATTKNEKENKLNLSQTKTDKSSRLADKKNQSINTQLTNNIGETNNDEIKNNKIDDSAATKKAEHVIADSLNKKKNIDSVNKKKLLADSTKKKTDSSDKKRKRIALAAGLGINQFFTVGSQQHSDYNSGGTSGVLSDYIPVPLVRAYFSKKLYLQIEAQINTPQYTKSLLASQVIKADTPGSGNPTPPSQNSVFIKKLFYFNIPLSIHYSPFENFYVGAGVQFSRLTNGVGLFQDNALTSTGFDSLTLSKTQSFKKDPVYKEIKTNEWRFLLDANYQWKNLVFGVRYNQALSNFINVQISSTQVTQARNSSIQLYFRYILWNNKKAKELFSKK